MLNFAYRVVRRKIHESRTVLFSRYIQLEHEKPRNIKLGVVQDNWTISYITFSPKTFELMGAFSGGITTEIDNHFRSKKEINDEILLEEKL